MEEYLAEEGFPLEFQTADIFRKAGISEVRQSIYLPSEDGNPRELDVVGVRTADSETGSAVWWLAECKENPVVEGERIPWVMFSSWPGDGQTDADHLWGTRMARAAIWTQVRSPEFMHTGWAATGLRGTGGRRAKKEQPDAVYQALKGISQATVAIAEHVDEKTRPDLLFNMIVLPMVVIRGPLFEATWDDDAGKVAIKEVPAVRVLWSGLTSSNDPMVIDVVQVDQLDRHLKRQLAELPALTSAISAGREVVLECLRMGSRQAATRARDLPEYRVPKLLAGLPPTVPPPAPSRRIARRLERLGLRKRR